MLPVANSAPPGGLSPEGRGHQTWSDLVMERTRG